MDAIVAATNGAVSIASGLAEARQMAKRGVLPMMLLLEGADALDGRFDDLQVLKRRGLLVVGLTSRRGNVFAEAATFPREIGGLTKKGRALLEACREHGLVVDLTHASTKTFWDVLSAQLSTVIVSHTATRALRDHPRNLDDLQILALSRYKGLMGLSFNPEFLKSGDSRASIDDVVRHILHIKSLGAVDALALGTDFGGIFPPLGLEHAGRLSKLTEALARQGLSDSEIAGIMGENALRVFTESAKNRGMMELPMGDVLRPVPMDCDSVTGEKDGEAELACDGFLTEHGATLSPSSRQRFRIQDKSREPISLELWGDPGIPWQVEAQNLSGKVLFHRMVQLDEQGSGSVFLPTGRDLTRLFCSPTRPASLKEVVIWGR
jgi:microsomal dipeptidase-like Zn-dependent dipeptidase